MPQSNRMHPPLSDIAQDTKKSCHHSGLCFLIAAIRDDGISCCEGRDSGITPGCEQGENVAVLKHLHNAETHFSCPQTSLSLDLQCRDDISELKYTFRGSKEQNVALECGGT